MTDEKRKPGRPRVYAERSGSERGAPRLAVRLDPAIYDHINSQPEGPRAYLERTILESILQPTGSDASLRDAYAEFGRAYYLSECLQTDVCNRLVAVSIKDPDMCTRPRIEEIQAEVFSLTLGESVRRLSSSVSPELLQKLDQALAQRNSLAHGFWFKNCTKMTSEDLLDELKTELNSMTNLFQEVSAELSSSSSEQLAKLGVTDERILNATERLISGRDSSTWLTKEEQKKRARFLKQKHRVVGVWESGTGLFFELGSGEILQPCDCGLGWSCHQAVESTWTLNSQIQANLPATICPRPDDASDWKFEFKLKNDVVLRIFPATGKRAYYWSLEGSK